MPKRPKQHEIADQGVAEIARVLSNAGWACDRVQADYGEDLICQTSHNGSVDPHRILIQVKSTRKNLKASQLKLRISRETLLKWLSDSSLVIVCLWSIADQRALYQVPSQWFQLYDVDLSNQSHYVMEFSSEEILTEASADLLAWRARLRSINLHFLERKNLIDCLIEDEFDSKEEYLAAKDQLQKNLFSVGLKFLFYIGLLESNGPSFSIDLASCMYELLNLGVRATAKPELKLLKLEFNEILLFMILARASRTVQGVGFPIALLENSVEVLSVYIIHRIRNGDETFRDSSKSKIKRIFCSMAKRLWLFGATLTDAELAEVLNSDALQSLAKKTLGVSNR